MVEKPLFAVDVFPLKSNQSSPISGTYRLPSSGALSGSSGFPRADGQTQGLSEHGVPPIAKTVKMLKPLIFFNVFEQHICSFNIFEQSQVFFQ